MEYWISEMLKKLNHAAITTSVYWIISILQIYILVPFFRYLFDEAATKENCLLFAPGDSCFGCLLAETVYWYHYLMCNNITSIFNVCLSGRDDGGVLTGLRAHNAAGIQQDHQRHHHNQQNHHNFNEYLAVPAVLCRKQYAI